MNKGSEVDKNAGENGIGSTAALPRTRENGIVRRMAVHAYSLPSDGLIFAILSRSNVGGFPTPQRCRGSLRWH